MKKRSLVAAVAMLIVSAIVLTSATYAWFAVGGNASISTMTGNVTKSQSGVMLQTLAANAEWKNELSYVDLVADTTNNWFATNYKDSSNNYVNPGTTGATADGEYYPISMSDPISTTAGKFAYTISDHAYSETTFPTGKTINDMYDCYTFRIAKVAEDNKNVTGRLRITGSAAQAARVAVYTSTDGGSNWSTATFYSGEAEATWKPIQTALVTSGSTAIVDKANGSGQYNYIVDESDTNYVADTLTSSAISCTNAASWVEFTITNPHAMGYSETVGEGASAVTTMNTLVKVYVWLEGNDDDCYPNSLNVPGKAFSVEWGFKVTGESW